MLFISSAYPLSVDLVDVGYPLCKDVTGHLVAVLVAEFGSFALGPLDAGAGVRDRSGHDASNRGRQSEDVGDGRGIDELVLFIGRSGMEHEA